MKKMCRWNLQFILAAVWISGMVAVREAMLNPVGTRMVRIFIVVAIPALWLLAIFLLRRVKWLAKCIFSVGLVIAVCAMLPGRAVDPALLRETYISHLRYYEGTPYVWGGETRRGIDCSGLVRRALIVSYAQLAMTQLNPLAFRAALDMWWHDCSARALRDRYRDLTSPLFTAESINAIGNSLIMPGDIAVTSDGRHVPAYLGDHQWIEADPDIRKVVMVAVPADSPWFKKPVHIMRWTAMTEASKGLRPTDR